jgi:hypothetical protein
MKISISMLITLVLLSLQVKQCPDTPFCTSCDDEEKNSLSCFHCQDSSFNTNTQICDLIPNDKIIPNCDYYGRNFSESKEAFCEICLLGFYIDGTNNSCKKCSTNNCAICSDLDECSLCFGKRFVDPVSLQCDSPIQCTIDGCNVCRFDLINKRLIQCLVCDESHTQFRSTNEQGETLYICKPDIGNCVTEDLDEENSCSECRNGFYLTSEKKCVANPSTFSNSIKNTSQSFNGSSTAASDSFKVKSV